MPTRSRAKSRRRNRRNARVDVQFACAARGAPSAARLRGFARAAANPAIDATVRIVGAAEGRQLNRAYRGKGTATNVLTFRYSRMARGAGRESQRGDIVLCHPVVVREARTQGKALVAHYAHLVVHGMLHLRGFDHERPRAATRMERREAVILARLGYRDPYAAERAALRSGRARRASMSKSIE